MWIGPPYEQDHYVRWTSVGTRRMLKRLVCWTSSCGPPYLLDTLVIWTT